LERFEVTEVYHTVNCDDLLTDLKGGGVTGPGYARKKRRQNKLSH